MLGIRGFIFTFGSICLVFPQLSVGQDACKGGLCTLQFKDVTEQPKGDVNGVNLRFLLGQRPSERTPVRLFVNGVELRWKTDFDISGLQLTLASPALVRPGDLLRAVYKVEAPVVTDSTTREVSPRGRAMVNQVLLESLRNNVDSSAATSSPAAGVTLAPGSTTSKDPDRINTPPRGGISPIAAVHSTKEEASSRSAQVLSPAPASKPQGATSLRMLKSALDGKATDRDKEKELTGFEGLGDQSGVTPYGSLLGAAAPTASPSRSASSAADARKPSRALGLLGDALDQTEPSGGASKHHAK